MSPAWTADVERLKILFLSFPLGGTFGPSMRQGVVKPNVLFPGSEKFPVDTYPSYPSGVGHRERGKAQWKCSPSSPCDLLCDHCDDKGTGLEGHDCLLLLGAGPQISIFNMETRMICTHNDINYKLFLLPAASIGLTK